MLALHMLTMCGATISALSLSSLQLMSYVNYVWCNDFCPQLISLSSVVFVADIFRSWLRINSVIIFGNLKHAFSGLLREIKFRNFE